jgi:predicted nucleic acid-binding Zn ribbon protein
MGEYSLGEALKEFLNSSKLKSSVQALRIEEVWEQIMGKTISKYTERIEIRGQTLFIHTSVAPLKQELGFQKERIIQLVNDALGEKLIREVIIQ